MHLCLADFCCRTWSRGLVKIHDPKHLGAHRFLSVHGGSLSKRKIRAGTQDRSLKAGTEAETIKKWFFLAFSLWLAQFALV